MRLTRPTSFRPTLPPLAGALVALALVVVAAPAGAQTIEACYVPASGSVYLIKQPGTPTECNSSAHKQITLTATGPAGPTGPQGPAGPTGPTGPTGPSGPLSGLEFKSAAATVVASGTANFGIFFATCPTGKSVMNFGYDPSQGNTGAFFFSRPAINGKQVTWGFGAPTGSQWTFYWTCVDGLLP